MTSWAFGPTGGSPSKFAWMLYYTSNNFLAFPQFGKLWRAMLFRDARNRGRAPTVYPEMKRRVQVFDRNLANTFVDHLITKFEGGLYLHWNI